METSSIISGQQKGESLEKFMGSATVGETRIKVQWWNTFGNSKFQYTISLKDIVGGKEGDPNYELQLGKDDNLAEEVFGKAKELAATVVDVDELYEEVQKFIKSKRGQ